MVLHDLMKRSKKRQPPFYLYDWDVHPNSDEGLVLGAALFRGGCKTRTQGFSGLELFSGRPERWAAAWVSGWGVS